MIQKCNFKDCDKAGICRAPKNRTLNEYFYFCREHASEYNKNWNYYENMSTTEINEDWERSVFGYVSKDTAQAKIETAEYLKFLDDFINGRGQKSIPKKETTSPLITDALKILELSPIASFRDIGVQYRKLAKLYHPDIAKNLNDKLAAEKFVIISNAYSVLENHFKK